MVSASPHAHMNDSETEPLNNTEAQPAVLSYPTTTYDRHNKYGGFTLDRSSSFCPRAQQWSANSDWERHDWFPPVCLEEGIRIEPIRQGTNWTYFLSIRTMLQAARPCDTGRVNDLGALPPEYSVSFPPVWERLRETIVGILSGQLNRKIPPDVWERRHHDVWLLLTRSLTDVSHSFLECEMATSAKLILPTPLAANAQLPSWVTLYCAIASTASSITDVIAARFSEIPDLYSSRYVALPPQGAALSDETVRELAYAVHSAVAFLVRFVSEWTVFSSGAATVHRLFHLLNEHELRALGRDDATASIIFPTIHYLLLRAWGKACLSVGGSYVPSKSTSSVATGDPSVLCPYTDNDSTVSPRRGHPHADPVIAGNAGDYCPSVGTRVIQSMIVLLAARRAGVVIAAPTAALLAAVCGPQVSTDTPRTAAAAAAAAQQAARDALAPLPTDASAAAAVMAAAQPLTPRECDALASLVAAVLSCAQAVAACEPDVVVVATRRDMLPSRHANAGVTSAVMHATARGALPQSDLAGPLHGPGSCDASDPSPGGAPGHGGGSGGAVPVGTVAPAQMFLATARKEAVRGAFAATLGALLGPLDADDSGADWERGTAPAAAALGAVALPVPAQAVIASITALRTPYADAAGRALRDLRPALRGPALIVARARAALVEEFATMEALEVDTWQAAAAEEFAAHAVQASPRVNAAAVDALAAADGALYGEAVAVLAQTAPSLISHVCWLSHYVTASLVAAAPRGPTGRAGAAPEPDSGSGSGTELRFSVCTDGTMDACAITAAAIASSAAGPVGWEGGLFASHAPLFVRRGALWLPVATFDASACAPLQRAPSDSRYPNTAALTSGPPGCDDDGIVIAQRGRGLHPASGFVCGPAGPLGAAAFAAGAAAMTACGGGSAAEVAAELLPRWVFVANFIRALASAANMVADGATSVCARAAADPVDPTASHSGFPPRPRPRPDPMAIWPDWGVVPPDLLSLRHALALATRRAVASLGADTVADAVAAVIHASLCAAAAGPQVADALPSAGAAAGSEGDATSASRVLAAHVADLAVTPPRCPASLRDVAVVGDMDADADAVECSASGPMADDVVRVPALRMRAGLVVSGPIADAAVLAAGGFGAAAMDPTVHTAIAAAAAAVRATAHPSVLAAASGHREGRTLCADGGRGLLPAALRMVLSAPDFIGVLMQAAGETFVQRLALDAQKRAAAGLFVVPQEAAVTGHLRAVARALRALEGRNAGPMRTWCGDPHGAAFATTMARYVARATARAVGAAAGGSHDADRRGRQPAVLTAGELSATLSAIGFGGGVLADVTGASDKQCNACRGGVYLDISPDSGSGPLPPRVGELLDSLWSLATRSWAVGPCPASAVPIYGVAAAGVLATVASAKRRGAGAAAADGADAAATAAIARAAGRLLVSVPRDVAVWLISNGLSVSSARAATRDLGVDVSVALVYRLSWNMGPGLAGGTPKSVRVDKAAACRLLPEGKASVGRRFQWSLAHSRAVVEVSPALLAPPAPAGAPVAAAASSAARSVQLCVNGPEGVVLAAIGTSVAAAKAGVPLQLGAPAARVALLDAADAAAVEASDAATAATSGAPACYWVPLVYLLHALSGALGVVNDASASGDLANPLGNPQPGDGFDHSSSSVASTASPSRPTSPLAGPDPAVLGATAPLVPFLIPLLTHHLLGVHLVDASFLTVAHDSDVRPPLPPRAKVPTTSTPLLDIIEQSRDAQAAPQAAGGAAAAPPPPRPRALAEAETILTAAAASYDAVAVTAMEALRAGVSPFDARAFPPEVSNIVVSIAHTVPAVLANACVAPAALHALAEMVGATGTLGPDAPPGAQDVAIPATLKGAHVPIPINAVRAALAARVPPRVATAWGDAAITMCDLSGSKLSRPAPKAVVTAVPPKQLALAAAVRFTKHATDPVPISKLRQMIIADGDLAEDVVDAVRACLSELVFVR